MKKISPFLWFDTEAEEAANFYVSLFDNSRIVSVERFLEGAPRPAGSVMTVEFELEGEPFTALNGGPEFKFSPAVSFAVLCRTQREIDKLWAALGEGGEEMPCGWITDRFGLTWQITPEQLPALLADPDREKAQRVFSAMMTMKKLEIDKLEQAAAV